MRYDNNCNFRHLINVPILMNMYSAQQLSLLDFVVVNKCRIMEIPIKTTAKQESMTLLLRVLKRPKFFDQTLNSWLFLKVISLLE